MSPRSYPRQGRCVIPSASCSCGTFGGALRAGAGSMPYAIWVQPVPATASDRPSPHPTCGFLRVGARGWQAAVDRRRYLRTRN
eukprot:2255115-Heterocapsa_arctica.AAC.1